ncbi:hypothetical protein M2401_005009 [Pseudomonas sp. JUb42]|uniref:hypothetical protein n=1 Tax=Pseudomonas sp. JUb42 TaxID=2940611 RepID=UPI0021677DB4|nr:hypothetical protein [Pseudomonas sp. JUb42]MCS3471247.1 hypothetical protein [Pseudomonas sp. JUb42]
MNFHPLQQADSDLLADLREILALIALASAVIASPKTPVIVARVAAGLIQNAAMAWADLLDGAPDEQAGDL